ncbi:hypothetical protein BKA70DRAFT_1291095 [Coprinopsis sp. MPI-PUGE-AT-0042]|nr:hypothetical protein BKA70DRAFT_1291095 [Coprinopsis sp. MPI-PUGE-AT-0042]
MASALKSAASKAPSKLSQILAQLKAAPQLSLQDVKSIKMSYAFRNDHWGARHFAKEQLPRIRWANPNIEIEVAKVPKTKDEQWRPELEVHFENGTSQTLNLTSKWSSTITKELMDLAGGSPWESYKADREAAGQPIIPGEDLEPKDMPTANTNLPCLATFLEKQPKAQGKEKKKAPIPPSATAPRPEALA